MARYRGSKGSAVLGGLLVGSPLLQGAEAQGQTAGTIDGSPLTGVVRPGDTFTVAGDAQVYTIVTGGVVASNALAITWTPAVQPGGGWADNAAVSFAANSIAQVREWEAEPSRPVIDATVMGDTAQRADLDLPTWSGRLVVLFDYADLKQKAYVDQVLTDASSSGMALTLVTASGKDLWGDIHPTSVQIGGRIGAYFEATIVFEGEGAMAFDWP
jgi:hypothetical protein